uniref:Uncharacterized protein n=1 Tax=Arundo donax TaxID=35708 RepID=A0A0A8Z647_ARUDO
MCASIRTCDQWTCSCRLSNPSQEGPSASCTSPWINYWYTLWHTD